MRYLITFYRLNNKIRIIIFRPMSCMMRKSAYEVNELTVGDCKRSKRVCFKTDIFRLE